MKKLLAILLSVLLIVSTFGVVSFATNENVAKVGNTEYATIDEAIAAWTNGTTLTLLADVTLSDVIMLSSTEYHILDLGTYTMTAASGKDAIQYVVNGRSSAGYALDIKADATNPGGITATGKAIVSHIKPKSNAPSKDRPMTRFYGGVFNASYVVKQGGTGLFMPGAGYTGSSSPYFYFYGGVYNGTIYTNRSHNEFYGGTFNGTMSLSVDSSAWTKVAGGRFKNLSNSMGSNLDEKIAQGKDNYKFTIGTDKATYDREVYIDDEGYIVVAAAEPNQGIEAAVAKTPNGDDYYYYSKVATESALNYTDVYMALEKNKTATITVYTDELDLANSSFTGTIVVPEGHTLTISNAPEGLKVEGEGEVVFVEPVAKIGDTQYNTLEDAIAAANNGDTVMLLKDVEVAKTIKVNADQKLTLDLNGFVIDGTEKVKIALMTYGDLTLKDSSVEQTGAIKAGIGTGGNAVNVTGGTFTMESGSIYSKNNALLIDENASTVNIKGGKLTAEPTTDNSAVMYISGTNANVINVSGGEMVGFNGILLWDNTEINITGGTIVGQYDLGIQGNGARDNTKITISGGSVSGAEAAIYHPQGGELNISGSANLTGATGVVVKGGTVNISGGTITATGEAGAYTPVNSGYQGTGDALYVEHYDNSTNSGNYGTPVVTITGGTFNSANGKAVGSYANTNNNVEALSSFISGGTFSSDVSDLCEEGRVAESNGNGSYEIVIKTAIATVNGVSYYDLQSAIDAAANGGTVVLVADISLQDTVKVVKDTNVTINLNGHTITGVDTTEKSFGLITNNGTLTINDTVGTGKISLSATIDSGWNRYSSVISNNPGGKLTVNGGTIEHLGGTAMAYAIDNLTNGKGTYAETVINGGTIKSTYAGIRQFLNGVEAQNILTVNGGTVMSDNRAIFFQDPSKNANSGTLTITAGAKIYGKVHLSVTEGSTEWPVEVSVAAEALQGESAVTNNYLPDGYVIENANGTYGVSEMDAVATVNGVNYYDLQSAIDAAAEGDTVVLLAPITVNAGETLTLDKNITITYTSNVAGEDMITNYGTLIIDGTTLIYNNTDTTASNVTVSTISCGPASVLEVKSGVVKNDSANNGSLGIYAFAIDLLTNGSLGDVTATISGGEIISTNYMAIRQFNNGTACKNTLTVTDGYIYGAKRAIQVHLDNNAAYTTISGGIIEAGEGGYALCLFPTDAENLSVTGGTFIGTVYSGTNGFISGGTFNEEVYSDYVTEGFEAVDNGDGTYGVEEKEEKDIFGVIFYIRNLPRPSSTTYQIGVFAGIDSLDYSKVGFRIYNADGVLLGQSTTKTVYSSVSAGGTTLKASDYGCYRIFGVPVTFPASYDNTTIYFEPFAVNFDGSEIVGRRVEINDINTRY